MLRSQFVHNSGHNWGPRKERGCMPFLEVGQKIEIDIFGLHMPGLGSGEEQATGTVVALGPGIITVQLEFNDRQHQEVTVSRGRVRL
jgi:hypothetical protein